MSVTFDTNNKSKHPLTRGRWQFLALHRCASCQHFDQWNQSDNLITIKSLGLDIPS